MSFESGWRLYEETLNNQADQKRRDAAEARAVDEHTMRMAELKRAAARQDQIDASLQGYRTALDSGGLTPDVLGQLQRTYGLTPDQVRTAGPGLQERLRSYDMPDSSDLQNAGPSGEPAAVTARNRGLNVELMKQRALAQARQGINLAKGDVTALAQGEAEMRGIDIQEDFLKNKNRLIDPAYRAQLMSNVNRNHSRLTILEGKRDNRGNLITPDRLVMVGHDGKGSELPLSEGQMEILAHAQTLMDRGMADQAYARIAEVDKNLAEYVKAGNEAARNQFTANETQRHNINTEGIAREQAGATRAHYQALQDHYKNLDRQPSKETMEALDVLYRKLDQTRDPMLRKELLTQINTMTNKAILEMGKLPRPIALDQKAEPTPDQITEMSARLRASDPRWKGVSEELVRAKARGILLGSAGEGSGALPNVWGGEGGERGTLDSRDSPAAASRYPTPTTAPPTLAATGIPTPPATPTVPAGAWGAKDEPLGRYFIDAWNMPTNRRSGVQ